MEMIDVLKRLRELDSKNPNVVSDAVENTEKMNGQKQPVTEAIRITADSPEDLPMIAQIMKLAGMAPVTPDMMPDKENLPVMKDEPSCGHAEPDGDEQEEGWDNEPDEEYKEYDPNYANIQTRNRPQRFVRSQGDNPLESTEKELFKAYEEYLNEAKKYKKPMKMKEASKPDFLDLDKDGDKKEPMKKAAGEKGSDKKETKGLTAKQKKLPAGLQKAIAKKKGSVKEETIEEVDIEDIVAEKKLTKPEAKEKEKIVKGMKKAKGDFKKRYGDDAEAVMYATATKMAKKKA
jgi:hypothetical protein